MALELFLGRGEELTEKGHEGIPWGDRKVPHLDTHSKIMPYVHTVRQ